MFPIFVGSVHDFGCTMTLFSEKILISNRCISGLMSNLIKKSLTVASALKKRLTANCNLTEKMGIIRYAIVNELTEKSHVRD